MRRSYLKSIEKWIIDALKRKKNHVVFLCNDIAQIISEICGINYRIFQLWVRAHCLNDVGSLDFAVRGAVKNESVPTI